MSRPTDYNLDPPDALETSLEQDLIFAVDMLLEYLKYHDVEPDMLSHLNTILAIRDEMRADELPEYTE